MPPIRPYDQGFATTAVERAREGFSRAEIAAALGASLIDLDAWAAEHPGFAVALADADTLARAWWDSQPRLALEGGKPFRAAAWAKAMAQRYGRSADRPKSAPTPTPPSTRTIFEIPDNGRERRRRDRGGG